MANHDEFVRKGFENLEVVVAFCRHFIDDKILDLVDIDRVGVEKGSFVDERLKNRYSDLLFSVPLRGTGEDDPDLVVRIYILIEHKSWSDRWAILQILAYMADIWKQEVSNAEEPAQLELPPIISIILHHGRGTFKGSTNFHTVVKNIPLTAPFVPSFEVQLIDLSAIPPEDIPDADPRLYAILSVMQSIFDESIGETAKEALRRLDAAVEKSGVRELIEAIITYVSQSAPGLSDEDAAILNDVKDSDGESIMATLSERWFAQGKTEGLAEGKAEGKAESVIDILRKRFTATPADLDAAIREVSDLERLNILLGHAVCCKDIDEFRHVLADPGCPR